MTDWLLCIFGGPYTSLDDCFINWIFGEDDSELPRSEYTIRNWTEYKKAFLDILIKKDNNRLTTDINYKATDTRQ